MNAGTFGSPAQLLILLAIILLVFGGKRLRNLGGDFGNAIKGFKSSMEKSDDKVAEQSLSLLSEKPTVKDTYQSHN